MWGKRGGCLPLCLLRIQISIGNSAICGSSDAEFQVQTGCTDRKFHQMLQFFLLENEKLLIGLGREVRKTSHKIILFHFYCSSRVGFYVYCVTVLILVLSLVL